MQCVLNAQNKIFGYTPIYRAAAHGYTEIVKILTPLSNNPNAPDYVGETPIFWAACNGHKEIVKLLAPLTGSPNAPDNFGNTPSSVANNSEICRILEPFKFKTLIHAKQEQQPPTKRAKKF